MTDTATHTPIIRPSRLAPGTCPRGMGDVHTDACADVHSSFVRARASVSPPWPPPPGCGGGAPCHPLGAGCPVWSPSAPPLSCGCSSRSPKSPRLHRGPAHLNPTVSPTFLHPPQSSDPWSRLPGPTFFPDPHPICREPHWLFLQNASRTHLSLVRGASRASGRHPRVTPGPLPRYLHWLQRPHQFSLPTLPPTYSGIRCPLLLGAAHPGHVSLSRHLPRLLATCCPHADGRAQRRPVSSG